MTRTVLDRVSIGFSAVCAVHCLILPVLLVFAPALTSMFFNHEQFHLFLMFLVLPTSIIALFMGCKQHGDHHVVLIGTIGLVIISLTAMISPYYHSELLEKGFTLLGAVLIAVSHYLNMKRCTPTHCHH